MRRPGPATQFATAFAAASLLLSSAANAAPIRAAKYVVSANLVNASAQAAVCATGAASTVAGAAAAAQAAPAQPGCVLPMVDAPAPMPVSDMPPPAVYVPATEGGTGLGVLPLLLGLVAIGGLLWLLLDDDDDEIQVPISPG